MKTLKLTQPVSEAAKLMGCAGTTNEKPWAGFDDGDLRVHDFRWMKRTDDPSLADIVVKFEERPLGTPKHFAMAVVDAVTLETTLFETHQQSDFAALFGENPQFV